MVDFTTLGYGIDTTGLRQGEAALNQFAAANEKAAASGKKLEVAAAGAADKVRETSVQVRNGSHQMANLSAQINDIGVMLAAGQSPFQLALQQGTQLNQVFAQMGGGVPAIKAMAQAFVSMINPVSLATIGIIYFGAKAVSMLVGVEEKSAKTTTALDDLSKAVKALKESQDQTSLSASKMMAAYGTANPAFRAVLKDMVDIRNVDIESQFRAATTSLIGLTQATDAFTSRNFAKIRDTFNFGNAVSASSRDAIAGIMQMQAEIVSATDKHQRLKAAVALRDELSENTNGFKNMNAEASTLREGLNRLIVDLVTAGAEMKSMTDNSSRAAIAAYKQYGETRAEGEKQLRTLTLQSREFQLQTQLMQAIHRYGENSVQVEALRRREAENVANETAKQLGLTGNLYNQYVAMALAAHDVSVATQDASNSAELLSSAVGTAYENIGAAVGQTWNWESAMAGVRSQILGIASALSSIGGGMISNAAKFVEINALKAGKSVAEARVEVEKFNTAANYDGRIAAAEGKGGILGWAEAAGLRAAKSLELAGIAADEEIGVLRKNAMEAERASNRKGRAGASAAKKAAREAEQLEKKLNKETLAWQANLSPIEKYKQKLAELDRIKDRLSQDEMSNALKQINVELIDGIPLAGEFVDIMSEGLFNGFKGTLSNIMGMFKKWLAEMMATALKNRIVMSLGMNGLGVRDALSSALGAAGAPVGGMGGVMGSVLSGAAALGKGVWTGLSSVIGGLGTGGLSGGLAAVGTALKGATAGLAGFGTALGAIALPVAAVVGVFSFFKKKVKELDAGIRVTTKGMNTMVEEFRKTETKRFWGLSKKTRTRYEEADAETQDAISSVISSLQEGVLKAAKVLGFGSQTFKNFAAEITVSTKGMTEEDALKAVQEAIEGVGDKFASMIPGLKRFSKDGETASETLSRLAQSLTTVNSVMDTLGHTFRATGLAGANVASKIADAFGGLDAMTSATQRFYETFYSEGERLAITTRQTKVALGQLNLAMPRTRDEYRAMIKAQNLNTEKGREAYATLIGLSDAFDLILPKISSFTKEIEALQNKVLDALEKVMDSLSDAIRLNLASAGEWRKASEGIRDYIRELRGTVSALVSPLQALRNNAAVYQQTLRRANAGNVQAAQDLPGAARDYLASAVENSRTREEAAMAQARVAVQLGKVATKSDANAVALEEIARLQQKQLDILTVVRDKIASGGALTVAEITRVVGQLDALNGRIVLRANDANTIVAGVDKSIKNTKLQANVNATVKGTAIVLGAAALTQNMTNLRTSLLQLRAAIVAETKRAQEAAKPKPPVVPPKPTPAKPIQPKPTPPKSYSLSDYRFSTYGLGGSEGMGDRTIVVGPLGGLKSFTSMFGGSAGDAKEWLRREKYPAFAAGGSHVGGPRIVGEKGMELENTGPSRIFSAHQTKDILAGRDDELVEEIRALRRQVADLEIQARKTSENTRGAHLSLTDIRQNGVGIDPLQNTVKVPA